MLRLHLRAAPQRPVRPYPQSHGPPMKHSSSISFILLACLAPIAAQAGRPLMPEDWYRFQTVSHLTVAPDGAAVAYLVTSYDKASDESRDALWTVDWSGTHG